MISLVFTPIYAGLLAILVIVLACRVVMFRRGEAISLGDEKGSIDMKRAVRAHANALENIPLALVLLVLLEINHLTPWLLNSLGLVFLVARALHAWGLSRKTGPSFGRFYGTVLTWLSILIMAILNIVVVITS